MGAPFAIVLPDAVLLDAAELARLAPFHLLVSEDNVVQSAGPALQKVFGADPLAGQRFADCAVVTRPRGLDQDIEARELLGKCISLEMTPQGDPLPALSGYAAKARSREGRPFTMLILTPGANARALVEDHGLCFSDFGPADGSADLMALMAIQEETLESSRKLSAELRVARDAARHMALSDALTGLANRRAVMEQLESWLATGAATVVHADLDRFKDINDTYGHAAGDAALRHFSDILKSVTPPEAVCARLGGDEFVIALQGARPEDELARLAGQVVRGSNRQFVHGTDAITTGVSVGVAQAEQGTTADMLLHNADLALYEAKRAGRSSYCVCTPDILARHAAFQALSADIRRGIAAGEFVAHFQPQVMAGTGGVYGFEALARWQHPEHGLLPPGAFLAAARRSGLMRHVDAAVRKSALQALRDWQDAGLPVPKISLNIDAEDLADASFRDKLLQEIAAHGVAPNRVALEVLETVLYDEDVDKISEVCSAFTDAGFALALDDFGTGHASILSLINLPLSLVKIDRAFVTGVAEDARKRSVLVSMMSMAQSLDIEVLAEGVESREDEAMVTQLGCRVLQGYHYARPMDFAAATDWARSCAVAAPDGPDRQTQPDLFG